MRYNPTKKIKDLVEKKHLESTEEQSAIVSAALNGDHLVVQAYSGTGKTATAQKIADVTQASGYFIVFSRAARRDAQNRMPMGMQAITGHALAFRHVVKESAGFTRKLEAGTGRKSNQIAPALILKQLNLKDRPALGATAKQLALAISVTIREFEISDARFITPEHVPHQAIPGNLRLHHDADTKEAFIHFITTQAGHIWREMESERSPFPIGHDTYLKILHLRQPYLSGDLWLLDEYQDTTPVMDAIVQQQEGQKIYIGDPYQAIFGWRGAIDALQRPIKDGARKLHLTQSFRFNHQIAGIANTLLSSLGETAPLIGQNYELMQMDMRKHHTVLVRNNVKMLSVIGEYRALRQSVYVSGGIPRETIIKAESAYALFRGDTHNIKISLLRDMGSWANFCDLAKSYEDINPEYADLVEFTERYRSQVPDILDYAHRTWDQIKNDPGRITLMTAHRSKGAEFSFVALRDDLALRPAIINKLKGGDPLTLIEREQVNLLYVALTRCKKGITLPQAIKQNLLDLSHNQEIKAASVTQEKKQYTEDEIRARTAEFIARHRPSKEHSQQGAKP